MSLPARKGANAAHGRAGTGGNVASGSIALSPSPSIIGAPGREAGRSHRRRAGGACAWRGLCRPAPASHGIRRSSRHRSAGLGSSACRSARLRAARALRAATLFAAFPGMRRGMRASSLDPLRQPHPDRGSGGGTGCARRRRDRRDRSAGGKGRPLGAGLSGLAAGPVFRHSRIPRRGRTMRHNTGAPAASGVDPAPSGLVAATRAIRGIDRRCA